MLYIAMAVATTVVFATDTADSTLRVMEATTSIDGSKPYAELAQLIRQAQDESALRRFACACASHALDYSGLPDQSLPAAIEMARSMPGPEQAEPMRLAVRAIVDRFDREADEAPGETAHLYFREARAAGSVLACLDDSPRAAAAEACYEALNATEEVDAITQLGREMLK